jgi:hypothetical protein
LEQPFYQPGEIEFICTDELQKLDLYPSDPGPIRIDRFIERRFHIEPTYEKLPNGVLGLTRFGAQGVEEIIIARSLDEDGTTPAERRLRTTLAHEGGHGLLHAHLFVLSARPASLFGDGLSADAPKIMCREGGISGVGGGTEKKPPYRWYEFQANQAIGGLLLPKSLVDKALLSLLVARGGLGLACLPIERRERATRVLADTFDVNPVVARLRLESLYPASANQQLTL